MGMYGGNRLTRGVVGGGGGPAPVTLYSHGYPGDPTAPVENDVVFQLMMQETSAEVIDSVTSIAIPERKFDAAGLGPNYTRNYFGAEWANFANGKHGKAFPNRGGWGSLDATLLSNLSLNGANDMVFEFVYNSIFPDVAQRAESWFNTVNWTTLNDGGINITVRKEEQFGPFSTTEHIISLNFYAAGGGNYAFLWRFDTTLALQEALCSATEELRKVRITYTASTNTCELFINGVSYGTRTAAGANTKTFPAHAVNYLVMYQSSSGLWNYSVVAAWWTPIHSLRITHGNNTNNFGGPGGG
jgi:hypothetical protein